MDTNGIIELVRERIHDERHLSAPPEPPVSEESWQSAENAIGYALPPLLRQLYLRVGNGGFGPGYGLLSTHSVGMDSDDPGVVELHLVRQEVDPETPLWIWPDGLVALNDWGCAIRSCVDCTDPDFPMVRFDPNGLDPEDPGTWEASFVTERMTFDEWISAWASGVELRQPQRMDT